MIHCKIKCMKKIIWLLIISSSIWSCGNSSSDSKPLTPAVHAEDHQHQDSSVTKLALNAGVKWKSDSSTQNNVLLLSTTLDNFNSSGDRNLEAYHNLALDLQRGLSKMVNECKMKGPEHDALHVWLQPLMGQVRDLKKSSDVAGGATLTEALQGQLKEYYIYFQP